jgi:glycosyltransferase involved in cell wall biosynthesis
MMEDKNLAKSHVSVIIPTFNRAHFLPPAIESILNQSFKDIEIIIVDDGSTDDTKTAIEPYTDKVQYIITEHRGPAHARNVGMKAARGTYIAFLDSDDTYKPYKIEMQVSFMEDHPEVGMVYTEFSASYANGTFEEFHLKTYHDTYFEKDWHYKDIFPVKGQFSSLSADQPINYYIGELFEFILQGPLIPSPTILFRKKILEIVGFQNENYRFGEEYEFTVRICKHFKAAFLDIPTYIHHYHMGQMNPFFMKNQVSWKERIQMEIEACKVLLNTVTDWAYNDRTFYEKNRKLIDERLAELQYMIGMKWLYYGDLPKAKQFLENNYLFHQRKGMYQWILFLPGILRRFIFRLYMILHKWKFIMKKKSYKVKHTG